MGDDVFDPELDDQTGRPELPTLGARIAGAKSPVQQSPDAAQAKVGQTQQADASQPPAIQFDPAKLPTGILRSNPKPEEIPSPAVTPTQTTLADLMQRRSQTAAPIDPNTTDASGKKIYRMGIGQRILGTVANAAMGFGGRGGEPVYVGPGATNNRFSRDAAMQQQRVGALDTDISNQEKLGESQRKMYDDAVKQAYEGELGESRERTAAANEARAKAAAETADLKQQLADSQRQLNEARAAKANQPEDPKNEVEVANRYQTALMKGDKQEAMRWKGVLDELARQKAAGRDTSASDLAKTIQVAEYRGRERDKVDNDKERERQTRYSELDKNVAIKYDPNRLAQAKAKVDQDMESKYADRYQRVNDEADKMLGLTKAGSSLKTGTSGAPNKTPPPAGKPIVVDGKPFMVTGYNPKTKKPKGYFINR